jgi:hypothetical protein
VEPTRTTQAAEIDGELPPTDSAPEAVAKPAKDEVAVEQKAAAPKSSAKTAVVPSEPRIDETDRPAPPTRVKDQPAAESPEVPQPVRNTAGPARRQPIQQARRDTSYSGPSAPVSSIEDVFTGMTPDEVRREARRRWEMQNGPSEDEIRRERRRQRRIRQQQNAWPF